MLSKVEAEEVSKLPAYEWAGRIQSSRSQTAHPDNTAILAVLYEDTLCDITGELVESFSKGLIARNDFIRRCSDVFQHRMVFGMLRYQAEVQATLGKKEMTEGRNPHSSSGSEPTLLMSAQFLLARCLSSVCNMDSDEALQQVKEVTDGETLGQVLIRLFPMYRK